jgi:hypothetical protein
VYYRPSRKRFPVGPDYWLHEVEQAPVFPHELSAMDPRRVATDDPELHAAIWGEPDQATA